MTNKACKPRLKDSTHQVSRKKDNKATDKE